MPNFLTTPFQVLYAKLVTLFVLTWDINLALINLVAPKKKIGHVVPTGAPGESGHWPEYIAPNDGDSRCACPALNTMANHGIIPRSGRNVKFTEVNKAMGTTFALSPSLCYFVPNDAAHSLKKKYATDTFDLEEVNSHNMIEHDASFCREDFIRSPDQSAPSVRLINDFLDSASGRSPDGEPLLTTSDLSRYASKRRAESKATNPTYELSLKHRIFGSLNVGVLVTLFGGDVQVLRTFLLEERIPDGWEPSMRSRMGLTLAAFNAMAFKVERGIKKVDLKTPNTSKRYREATPLLR